MKTLRLLCLAGLVAVPSLAADDREPLINTLLNRRNPARATRSDPVDLKRIVNQSNSFLKEREPEINAEEYALYEKVVEMLELNVELGLRMLEGMMDQQTKPSPAFEFVLGNVYYAAGQVDRAETHYRSAVTRFPSFLRAWDNLGILYYTAGRHREAVECFSKAVTLGDRDADTLGLLGYCLEQQGKLVPAETAYLQAVTADPDNSAWAEGLMRVYLAGKQFGRAEALLQDLIAEHPDEQRYWLTYASVLVSQGKKMAATVLLETACGTGIAGTDELLLLGDLYAEQRLITEALATYEKVLGTARDRSETKLLQFTRLLIASEKFPEADRSLATLEKNAPPESRGALLHARADLCLAKKDWAGARANAEALLALDPLDGPALFTLGRTYTEENDLPRALLAFEAAYRIPETTYRASLELAGIELKFRRYARSAEYLEKALSIQRTDAVEAYLIRVKSLIDTSPHPND